MGLLKFAKKIKGELKTRAGDLSSKFGRLSQHHDHDRQDKGGNRDGRKSKAQALAGGNPLPAAFVSERTNMGIELEAMERSVVELMKGIMEARGTVLTPAKEQALESMVKQIQEGIHNLRREKAQVEDQLQEMEDALLERQQERAKIEAGKVLREHEAVKLQREVAELKGKLAERDKKDGGSSTIILGRGGFGLVRQDEYPVGPDGEEVYTPVAVKTVYNNRDDSMREGEIMEKLKHRNIPVVHDYYLEPTIIMELVKGKTIYQAIRETPDIFTAQATLQIFQQVFSALAHVAHKSIAHRDIKPENTLITEDLTVKIVDFGLAVDVEDEEDKPRLQCCSGTPKYMAPEMIRLMTTGEHMKPKLMPRLDVWAAGVMLFELLTGTIPFDVTAMDQAKKREDKRAAAIELEGRIRSALQSQPASALKPAAYKPLSGDSAVEGVLWKCVEGALRFDPGERASARSLEKLLLSMNPPATTA